VAMCGGLNPHTPAKGSQPQAAGLRFNLFFKPSK